MLLACKCSTVPEKPPSLRNMTFSSSSVASPSSNSGSYTSLYTGMKSTWREQRMQKKLSRGCSGCKDEQIQAVAEKAKQYS